MKYKALIAASLAILFVPSAAHAVSITNNDKKEYQLTIFEGEKSRDLTIKPSETIDGVCEKLCSIRLNNDEDNEYEFEGKDTIAIEDGYLTYADENIEQGSTSEQMIDENETENENITNEEYSETN